MRNKLFLSAVVLFFVGITMLSYPKFQSIQSASAISHVVTTWREQVPTTIPTAPGEDDITPTEAPLPFPELWEAMETYNRHIFETNQSGLVDADSYQREILDLEEYGIQNGMVGVISIPGIRVEMPLYLGASRGNMAKGFAQLSQTSMPVGGENTNCVVAGHRGWRGAAYLRDADKLKVGDDIYLENLWETLTYEIVHMEVIEPDEIEKILIQPGRDLLTLFTCTPYRVGTHRLLIVAERRNTP